MTYSGDDPANAIELAHSDRSARTTGRTKANNRYARLNPSEAAGG